uniref:Uncharacterized protein n=1 Tax=Bracon brevicornis TaxID=1563983 RepID=A0A6V7KYX5_9HYME
MLVILYTIILLKLSPCRPDATEEPEVSTTTDEMDEDAVGNAPVTEEVIGQNIKLNDPSERNESEEEPEDELDPNWDINLAIRDVAYYLRAHKFLDYDHRYYKDIDEAKYQLYQSFPRPPLRSLHWEVHKNCDDGFTKCLKYLYATVQLTSLKRTDDTITIMKENNWNLVNNSQQILSVQKECQMAQRRDNLTSIPFQGPIGNILAHLM